MSRKQTTVAPDCLLTLALPQALEEELLDALLALPEQVPGFTVLQAQGVGAQVALPSSMEQVTGRARRVLVQVALRQDHVPSLLQALKQHLPSPQIAYWIVPLLAFGRLGDIA
ncbi:MAG: DUF3240 family protein [Burkholderiaceae bacterium]|nr:DUF3240 family protein [Burkholderiaceae bacterium]